MESAERVPAVSAESGLWRYRAYRAAAAIVPRVPYVLAAPVAAAVGLALWAARPAARRRVDANLAHIPRLAADPAARAAAVRGVFCHLALNYLDLFRAHTVSETDLREHFHLDGIPEYEAVCAAGRGVILITGHLGNFDLAAARLGMFGTPITIAVERLKPERLFALVSRLRTHHSVRTVPADTREGLRALLATLRRGEAVLLTVDRDIVGTAVEVPFFGTAAPLPTGAALLARRSGAALLWASSYRDGLWHARGSFVPVMLPPPPPTSAAGAADAAPTKMEARASERTLEAQLLIPIVHELERQIASHPQQWMASLAPIWPDRPAEPVAFVDESLALDATQLSQGRPPIGTPQKSP
jgi:KDO2-lipid IV(A) lauroyltransferase